MIPSAYADTFARDHLPPRDLWPDLIFDRPEYRYPDRLNCVSELLDRWLDKGWHDRPCMITDSATVSYGEMAERVNRIANVLTGKCGLVPGGRVLLRSANNPQFVAAYLAVMKAGGIAVATMPLLRAKELSYPIGKAKIALALCDARLAEEMEKAKAQSPDLKRIVYFNGDAPDGLEALMRRASPRFTACDTAADDVCLIGFTSGTTGEPKGTMHFHRDVLLIADGYGRHVLKAEASDRFIGSPPLAFTFGLGGLVIFPMRVGASSILLEKAAPDDLIGAIDKHQATITFTAPTAYRAMLAKLGRQSGKSLRKCVSAGETLPKAVFDAWLDRTGIKLMDGIGATEMLHIFIGAPEDKIRAGSTGLPVPGYQARIVDAAGNEAPRGTPGRLAVKGPIGCRYLDDKRQRNYVEKGWNITGDTFIQDEDGYFWYQARSDDMIISAGYNISGPEIENALLTHPAIAECAVIGVADEERGMVPKAFIVLRPGNPKDAQMVKLLQDHVKAEIAPYKYPRRIEFRDALPKTQTGKLQRFALRAEEAGK
ncbi:benzoate-CoA ligase family protein [Aestuariivirga sp. YIM B02566]|uniref:Benzoate-CoA ligase family protein n=1 Tax=Taklimakanibacter albus TaxID=2800327 RepID=A0ACC5R8I9_9HYPH|nr:benzoate-CoA ligase family protein [Aestuariivirga sp. YIM B02566]MBK1868806.1 benzoate-CoA ligase family protein [Aestuariivirga sp. YIM B02566]